jgi:PTH1 family peptidyl-tRNA hydrolase
MKLIVGLGNPGEKYAGNRHNIGFMAADEIARGYNFGPWRKRFQGLTAEGQIGTEKCILLKPATYMNESGRAAGEAMRFYKLSAGDVIVIHDELDLKPGTVRVKTGGGNAGHNGLKSLSAYIGNEYMRVRLGIGHPGDKALVTNYVLQDFAKADRQWLDPFLEGIARGMERLAEGGGAAFLSEAARGRVSPAAAKLNGATPASGVKVEVPAAKAVAAQSAPVPVPAESKPVEMTRVASIQVVASREASGGTAVSSFRILPEPERRAPEPAPEPAAAKPAPVAEAAPQPAAAREAAPGPAPAPATIEPASLAEAAPQPAPAAEAAAAPAAPEPAPVAEAAPQPAAAAVREAAPEPEPAKAAPAPQPAAAQRTKGGFFHWLFRKRIRGGAHTQ